MYERQLRYDGRSTVADACVPIIFVYLENEQNCMLQMFHSNVPLSLLSLYANWQFGVVVRNWYISIYKAKKKKNKLVPLFVYEMGGAYTHRDQYNFISFIRIWFIYLDG